MPVHPDHRRDRVVTIRFTKAEYEELEGAAGGERSLSDWMRTCLLLAAREVKEEGE